MTFTKSPSPDGVKHSGWLDTNEANRLCAEDVASALGLSVSAQGRHVELDNGMRGTYKNEKLVWCHKNGCGIGDNCALAMTVTAQGFRDAIAQLLRASPTRSGERSLQSVSKRVLVVPPTYQPSVQAGVKYLNSRGISNATITTAAAGDALRFVTGAVLFVGHEETTPRSCTRRGYLVEDPAPKRDLSGSDKSFPVIIRGDYSRVWIVEGAVDALALHSQHPDNPPTVIVSGGANCTSWIKKKHVSDLLESANTIVVAFDCEACFETQERTDAAHQRQIDLLIKPDRRVLKWMPPAGFKDLAELNAAGLSINQGVTAGIESTGGTK